MIIGQAEKKGFFKYDVDVSAAFGESDGEAVITLREPTADEMLGIGECAQKNNLRGIIPILIGCIVGTNIKTDESGALVNVDWLKQYMKDHGSVALTLWGRWQAMLPFQKIFPASEPKP